jgi:glycerol-3-phosphate dehydrogenase
VNCAGPWIDRVLGSLGNKKPVKFLKAVVLVTRPLVKDVAVGVASASPYTDADAVVNKGHRYLFITPWRHTSLVGTFQMPHGGNPDLLRVTENEIYDFIRQTNAAFPGGCLKREDVHWVLCGLVPSADGNGHNPDTQLQKQYEIRDNAAADNVEGLVSVTGVKYTTARRVAEKTVDLIFNKLGLEPQKFQSPGAR